MDKKVWETLRFFVEYMKRLLKKWLSLLLIVPKVLGLLNNYFQFAIPFKLFEPWISILATFGLVWAGFLVFRDLLDDLKSKKSKCGWFYF